MPAVLAAPAADAPREAEAVHAASRHFYWIDWLRFLAAFVVLADHARVLNWDGLASYTGDEGSLVRASFISASSLGRQAVVVFFVLSGWLVGGLALERVRAGTFDARAYAADRLSRVYVPLVPALLLTLAVVRSLDGGVDWRQYAVCLVGLQDVSGILKPSANTPLWTLGYEIWFYILAGCVATAACRGSAVWARLVGIAGAALATGVCLALGWEYLACWLIGVAVGRLQNRLTPAARPWTALTGTAIMAAGAWLYQVNVRVLPIPTAGFNPPPTKAAQLVVAAGALLLAASVSRLAPRTPAGRRIERAGGWLAAFSYTLYLTHFPVIGALRVCFGPLPATSLGFADWLRAVAWAAFGVVVALGMYALFERQTSWVRRWLRHKFAGTVSDRPLAAARGEPILAPAR